MSPATAKHSLKDKNHPQLGTTDLELHIFLNRYISKIHCQMKKMGSGILWVAQAIYINQKIYIYKVILLA